MKIGKSEMFHMKDGKKILNGDNLIHFYCPKCGNEMFHFRIVEQTKPRLVWMEYDCSGDSCGYTEEIEMDVFLKALED